MLRKFENSPNTLISTVCLRTFHCTSFLDSFASELRLLQILTLLRSGLAPRPAKASGHSLFVWS